MSGVVDARSVGRVGEVDRAGVALPWFVADECVLGTLENVDGMFARHTRKVGKKVIERMATRKIFEERLHRHACPSENGGSAHDVGVAGDR
jgi:hypothetical protein